MQQITALLTALPCRYASGARNWHVGSCSSIMVTWSHWLREKKKGGGIGLAGKCKPNPASKVCPDESLSLALGSIQPF